MRDIPTPPPEDMGLGERRDTGAKDPIAGLHAGIDIVVARMQEKSLAADADLVAKVHDALNKYVKYMREWVESVKQNSDEEVTLKALYDRLGNPMVDGVEVARRDEGIDPKRMLTSEGEQELYAALGVLHKDEKVSDIPRLYAKRKQEEGDTARAQVNPRDYVAVFPTNVEGVIIRIRKNLHRVSSDGKDLKESPFENIELHFSGDEIWRKVTGVTG